MKRKIALFPFAAMLLFGFLPLSGKAQTITGKVTASAKGDHKKAEEILPGANVYWAGTHIGTTTDTDGKFQLKAPETYPAILVASYVSYKSDSLEIKGPGTNIRMRLQPHAFHAVRINEKRLTTFTSTIDPIRTETITTGELERAACCNLSESFETNASVDVVENDAVSGTRKIRMLGLDGVYTQIQIENIPGIRGLASGTGLTTMPGTRIQSIQVSKGAGSVVNGHEAITGQINIELLKPEENDRLYLNLYGNHMGRSEANLQLTSKTGEKWATNLFLHGSGNFVTNDRNNDRFLDMPVYTHINVFNRWKYTGKKRMMQIMYKIVDERKQSGQTAFNYPQDFGTQNAYGIGLNTRQYEVFVKNGFIMPQHPGRSLGILGKANYYRFNAYFGNREYNALQRSTWLNAIYAGIIGTTLHKWKAGASFRYDHFQESFADSGFSREEAVPGTFFEYTYNDSEKFSAILGIRGDWHNMYGFRYSPRVHLKYNPAPLWVFRLSGGRGFRTPNVLADHLGLLASSRRLIVLETPKAEEAINYGGSFLRKMEWFGQEAYISADFFRTRFIRQLVADLDRDVHQVVFYNLEGISYSNSFQTDLGFEPVERLRLHFAYKFTDVKTTLNHRLQGQPFVPKHRALFSLAWQTANEIWSFDATTQWTGVSRIPNTAANPAGFRLEEQSEAFFKQHIQVSKQWRLFDAYLGVENAFNYRQSNPIIDAANPFGNLFDASMIWGPVNGRTIYLGFRYKLK